MTSYHLAQLNVGILRAPLDDPQTAGFVALLEPINALADTSPGFVWRLRDEETDDATSFRPFAPDVLVNLSVWESFEALRDFTYRTAHLDALRRRKEWFTTLSGSHLALWWVPAGHIPTVEEAGQRLEHIRAHGPTPHAFTFRARFDPPTEAAPDAPVPTAAPATRPTAGAEER